MQTPPLEFIIAGYVIFTWTLIWKGVALWRAAKYAQKNWFLAILIVNYPIFPTFGILELIYLFRFSKKRLTLDELKKGLKDFFSAQNKKSK